MSRFLVASLVGLSFAVFANADEFTATLVKVAEGKVTFARGAGKKKKETTLPADEKCRVVAAKYNAKTKTIEAGDEIPDGLKNARLQKLEEDTIDAWIRTNADNRIVELRLFQSNKKKK